MLYFQGMFWNKELFYYFQISKLIVILAYFVLENNSVSDESICLPQIVFKNEVSNFCAEWIGKSFQTGLLNTPTYHCLDKQVVSFWTQNIG